MSVRPNTRTEAFVSSPTYWPSRPREPPKVIPFVLSQSSSSLTSFAIVWLFYLDQPYRPRQDRLLSIKPNQSLPLPQLSALDASSGTRSEQQSPGRELVAATAGDASLTCGGRGVSIDAVAYRFLTDDLNRAQGWNSIRHDATAFLCDIFISCFCNSGPTTGICLAGRNVQ